MTNLVIKGYRCNCCECGKFFNIINGHTHSYLTWDYEKTVEIEHFDYVCHGCNDGYASRYPAQYNKINCYGINEERIHV